MNTQIESSMSVAATFVMTVIALTLATHDFWRIKT
jgi:hypothetical protein